MSLRTLYMASALAAMLAAPTIAERPSLRERDNTSGPDQSPPSDSLNRQQRRAMERAEAKRKMRRRTGQ